MQTEQPQDQLIFEETHERATTGKRFLNYLIDVIVFYLLIVVVGIAIAIISPSSIDSISEDDMNQNILNRFISLLFYAIYMGIVESIFKGKSIGKFITKTKAVNLDGSQITTKTAFLRGFSRAVPFCVFSAFGAVCNPWQDRWTNTMVIDEKQ